MRWTSRQRMGNGWNGWVARHPFHLLCRRPSVANSSVGRVLGVTPAQVVAVARALGEEQQMGASHPFHAKRLCRRPSAANSYTTNEVSHD